MRTFLILLLSSIFYFSNAQRVLVIGVDGARADVIEHANTPNIDALISNGFYSPHALNSDITVSGPGWSAILCGVWSDKHGVTNNSFDGSNYDNFPSFFKYVEEFDSNLNTVSICHWGPINNNIVLDADYSANITSDLGVELEVIDQLTNHDPHVIFAHFDDCDGNGHAHGFNSSVSQYVNAIETVDTHIGNVMNALSSRPNFEAEDWSILMTSDHGGIGFSHGGTTFEEENVSFIASGNSIPTELRLRDSFLVDANNCFSDSVELVFDGSDDYVTIPPNPLFDFGANQDFTVECRVRTSNAADVAIIGNKDWGSGGNEGFVFSFRFNSGPEWKVNIGDGSSRADINTGGSIADNEWHTLTVSFDRDGMMRMYEDGDFVDEADISFIGDIDTDSGLVFGTDINQSFDYLGSIAEVRIWNEVLSPSSIQNYACQSIDSNHPSFNSLIGYWKLNEGGQNTIVEDLTSNDNDGIITGASWSSSSDIYEYSYNNVPRVTDIAVSALAHLCVPIELEWNLDGRSWVNECTYGIRDCANPGINLWIGESEGEWTEGSNWSRGFVPLICDHVVVPENIIVILKPGSTGICRSLDVHPTSEVKILSTAQLDILEP